MKRSNAGYTLIEVLLASSVLMAAIAAATSLALVTIGQEESNQRISRCLNWHEQSMRLYQLGLEPSRVSAVMPPDPAILSHVVQPESLTIANLGTVEKIQSTLVFSTTPLSFFLNMQGWTSGESSSTANRSNTLIGIRPSLR